MPSPARRCLIIERHEWETGARSHQLQFPLDIANEFFGAGDVDRDIRVRFRFPADSVSPLFERDLTISRTYAQSGTRRTNRLLEMGLIPASFLFFEETEEALVYDLWWETDKAIVAARFHPWAQGRNSQHGRGRLAVIVPAPVPRGIDRVE
jgi:hypothetical protein